VRLAGATSSVHDLVIRGLHRIADPTVHEGGTQLVGVSFLGACGDKHERTIDR